MYNRIRIFPHLSLFSCLVCVFLFLCLVSFNCFNVLLCSLVFFCILCYFYLFTVTCISFPLLFVISQAQCITSPVFLFVRISLILVCNTAFCFPALDLVSVLSWLSTVFVPSVSFEFLAL